MAATTTDIDMRDGRGRDATGPAEMPLEGWKDILWRVWGEFTDDRITLIAAGATYYLLLALFPALAAFVSIYGFVADPVTIADHVAFLGGVLPSGGVELIQTQLESLAQQNEAALSITFLFGLLVALWSANNGIKTLFEALNIAYEEKETRGFIKLNLITLLFTLGAIVIGILFIVSVGVVPAVLAFVGLGGWEEALISFLRWPILFVASAGAIAVLYRYGPDRARAKWRWVTWGSVIATALWLVASILFSWYLANFADYNATYGSLGAVIGFMLWTWISVSILLLGAELNSEIEHQTARDSTTGPELPLGPRGAPLAETVGEPREAYEETRASGDDEKPSLPPRTSAKTPEREAAIARKPAPAPLPSWGALARGFLLPAAAIVGNLALEELDRRRARKSTPEAHYPRQPRPLD